MVQMSKYFSETKSLKLRVKVELDWSNYATKAVLNNAAGVDTLPFAKKTDLANLKLNVDKLDIDKLKNVLINLSNLKSNADKIDIYELLLVPVDLSKLSDVVKMMLLKNIYIMLKQTILKLKYLIFLL